MAGKRVDWLTGSTIAAVGKIANEKARAKVMQKTPGKRARCWASDGEYVWFRRKIATPAFVNRLNGQIAKGELKHMTTQDDVEIYVIQTGSPLKRAAVDLTALDMQTLVRETVIAACRADWVMFVDGLEEVAHRFRNARYSDGKPAEEAFAKQLYQEKLAYIFRLVELRGGPTPQMIDRAVQALRSKRGADNKRILVMGR